MKKNQFKQHIAITFRHLTKNIMVLVYRSIFPLYLTVLAPLKAIDHIPLRSCITLGWHSSICSKALDRTNSRSELIFKPCDCLKINDDGVLNIVEEENVLGVKKIGLSRKEVLKVAIDSQSNSDDSFWPRLVGDCKQCCSPWFG